MKILMRCICLADGTPLAISGQFLKDYDEDTGFSHWTTDKEEALSFASVQVGWQFWQSVLPSQPTRPWDGLPNRPLTAFSVEIGEFE